MRPSSQGCWFAAVLVAAAFWAQGSAAVTFVESGATVLGGLNLNARSVSLADIDNDGDLDMLFQGTGTTNQRLLRNRLIETGSLTYIDVTASMLPSPSDPIFANRLNDSWSAGWGDYDGDGKVDVFIGQANPDPSGPTEHTGDVLKNNWPAAFSNTSASTGLNDRGFHQNVGWADIDNDRDLDLIIGMEGPTEKHEIYLQGPPSSFTRAGQAAGFQADFGTKAYGTAIGDSDGDGDLDIYISTCRGGGNIRNNFFKNMLAETGTLSFVDIADTNGTQYMHNSYGTEFVDFDNDGDLDLYMTGAENDSTGISNPTKIFKNLGNNQFVDVDTINGHELLRDKFGNNVRGIDLNGSKAVDYDNDGDLDLYFHDNLAAINHRLFRNDGNWKFVEATEDEGLHIAAANAPVGTSGYDSAWGDLDRDGDQDLVDPNSSTVNGIATPERVFLSNASTTPNHWLYVELNGPSYNTTGLGASLYATVNDGTPEEVTFRREANTNIGTFNQSDLPVHFGLGTAGLIDELRIQWPDGSKQSLLNVAVDQYLTVSYLPGDYDGDGVVGTSDYVLWRRGMGTIYNQADFDVWRKYFGTSLPASSASALVAVPEPAAICLIVSGLAILGARRRRAL